MLAKSFLAFPLAIILIGLIWLNINLHYQPTFRKDGQNALNNDLRKELESLKNAIEDSADYDMQDIYPEGFVFLNAVYGLAWCNFLKEVRTESPLFDEGMAEIDKSWKKIDSDHGRKTFDEYLTLPYGSFYNGWSCYLLGQKLKLTTGKRKASEVDQFKKQCQRISTALKAELYPETYQKDSWPADVMLCVASLSTHDKIFRPIYKNDIRNWITRVKSNLDAAGLIPHAADAHTGKSLQDSRGSSMGLILVLLKDIDANFAHAEYKLYKRQFIDSRLGLWGVQEYRDGDRGTGDVDSGPMIFQMGASATIVGMQTTSLYGDHETSSKIRNTVEGLTFPYSNKSNKKYLFDLLPMADAFIAWGHSNMQKENEFNPGFILFHSYSIGISLIIAFIIYRIYK